MTKQETEKDDIISKICEEQGYKLAQRIDDKMALVIKPKPKWLPTWLYKKVIRDCVEQISVL